MLTIVFPERPQGAEIMSRGGLTWLLESLLLSMHLSHR
jgi:hypothetical protein